MVNTKTPTYFRTQVMRNYLDQIERSECRTRALHDEVRAAGCLPSPAQQPAGDGAWAWLENGIDDIHALALGYHSPLEVELARAKGIFQRGTGENSGPQTVWIPNHHAVNPTTKPIGRGQFEYLTLEARDIANLNLGRSIHANRFANPDAPTANEVYDLRQDYYRRMAHGDDFFQSDPTANIELIWTPHDRSLNNQILASWNQQNFGEKTIDEEDPRCSEIPEGHRLAQLDPNSKLPHDPKNRGENDQTGDANAKYHTRLIGDKVFTIDRSRAHVTIKQPHKSWIVTKDGRWRQYLHYYNLDWNNKTSVENMNTWRDQELSRNQWPHKRRENDGVKRQPYQQEERQWLFDQLVKDGNPKYSVSQITKEYNQRFNQDRKESGITAMLHRLKDEWKKYGGKMKPETPQSKAAQRGGATKQKRAGTKLNEADMPAKTKRKVFMSALTSEDENSKADSMAIMDRSPKFSLAAVPTKSKQDVENESSDHKTDGKMGGEQKQPRH
ncbi:hypothetical protein M433DRAFT_542908 [Acidomyces richmondensis BFW]|nr:hypothetical protein M433DRAFT_542908 [Acidomyces richmondensis BFW]